MESFNNENKKNVANVIGYIYNNEAITSNIMNRILNELLWSATADYKKKDDCKYKLPIWSEGAIQLYTENQNFNGLKHEHLFPKKLIKEKIENDPENTYNILYKYAHAAVVTREEDQCLNDKGYSQKIPDNYINLNDPLKVLFSRYIETNINLKFADWRNNNEPFGQNIHYLRDGNINYEFIHSLSFDNWL
jgi:hypothetical protein